MRQAPKHLTKKAKRFWHSINSTYQLEPHHYVLLEKACECLDRIQEARDEVEKGGAYYEDRFGQPKPHPGLQVEKGNAIAFSRLIREIGLDVGPEEHGAEPPTI